MTTYKKLSTLLLVAGMISSPHATAQWFGPWGSENDLSSAWGLEPESSEDPEEGPGVTIDYNNAEQPFGMNVQSGGQDRGQRTYPMAPVRPAAPAPIAKARPAPPKPVKPIAPIPRSRQDYYQRRAPQPQSYGYRQPVRPMPYYAPRPLPPIRMPTPLPPYPYYRR